MKKYFGNFGWLIFAIFMVNINSGLLFGDNKDDIKEIRLFVSDVIYPYYIIKGSKEQPQRLAFKHHVKALKLLILNPNIIDGALSLNQTDGNIAGDFTSFLDNSGLGGLRGRILAAQPSAADGIILNGVDQISDEKFNQLNILIDGFMATFNFNKVGLEKLEQIKIDPNMGNIGQFIELTLKNYYPKQAIEDKRLIIGIFLRTTMPDDSDENKLLAVIKGSGPFFHKIIQLIGDYVNDSTEEGKKLKNILNEVKRNLLPIDEYHLDLLIKEAEAASNQRFKMEIIKTLGVASIGHALLVSLADKNTGKNEKVVLKFVKPGVKDRAEREIDILLPIALKTNVLNFFKGTINDIMGEMDLKNEFKNLRDANEIYNTNDPQDRVVVVSPILGFPESSKWLAMTLAAGRAYSDFSKDQAKNDDERLDREIEYLIRGIALEELTIKWMMTAFFNKREGFYHGDLHAGNLIIDIKTDEIKKSLKSKFGNVGYKTLTRDMIQQTPKNNYKLYIIDLGNIGQLTPSQRLHVLNFFISTVDGLHSWEGFIESYEGLIGVKLDATKEKKLREDIKKIFDENPNQNSLLGKLITFFLGGSYPELPSVMANFGRSQAMLNNIFNGIQNDAKNLGLNMSDFSFGNAVLDPLINLLVQGTLLVFSRVDVAGNQLYVNIGNLNSIISYGIKEGISAIKNFFAGKIELGGSCQTLGDCKNWTTGGLKGVACCNGKCEEKRKDWAGVYYCPYECVGAAFGKPGSCQ